MNECPACEQARLARISRYRNVEETKAPKDGCTCKVCRVLRARAQEG